MSLILSGTDGLSDIDGSAATPAIRGTDANTGIFFPAADTIAFSEGGAEAMRIDSSGNVGIGTNSPSALKTTIESNGGQLRIRNTTTRYRSDYAVDNAGTSSLATYDDTGAVFKQMNIYASPLTFNTTSAGAETARIDSSGNVGIGNTNPGSFDATGRQLVVGNGSAAQGMTIYTSAATAGSIFFAKGTTGSDSYRGFIQYGQSGLTTIVDSMLFGTAGTERMRIDSSGNVGIGTSSPSTYGKFAVIGNSYTQDIHLINTVSSNPIASRVNGIALGTPTGFFTTRGGGGAMGLDSSSGNNIVFYTDNGSTYIGAGSISSTGSATAYGVGTSDYRTKENVSNYTNGLSTITSLRPVSFTWKASQEQDIGFIAHEIQAVIPSTINGEKDAVDGEGKPKMQIIFPAPPQMIANLVAAIQEQQALITDLTARITALETP